MADSFLSDPHYGYDIVASVTQRSVNSTLKRYLYSLKEPTITMIFVLDKSGSNPVPMDYEAFKKSANGSDPFAIPAGINTDTDKDFQNIYNARFVAGFRAKLGLPPGAPASLPDLVDFNTGASSVMFNLMCSQFNVVQITDNGRRAPLLWQVASQTPSELWIFPVKINLSLSTVEHNDYGKMPPPVQAAIKNLGAQGLSIQQLWFDLTTFSMYGSPIIPNFSSTDWINLFLQKYFCNAYIDEMKKAGSPLLGCAVIDHKPGHSTLQLTDLNFETTPWVDSNGQPTLNASALQKQASTLNYLFATSGNHLPPAVPFQFNWVDTAELGHHDGVIAINRVTFAKWLQDQVNFHVRQNCWQPSVYVGSSGTQVSYQASARSTQTPVITYPTNGDTVLSFAWTARPARDSAGSTKQLGGEMELQSTYKMDVRFTNNQIIITQTIWFWLNVRFLSSWASGVIVNRTKTDTYTLSVDKGNIVWSSSSKTENHDDTPSVNKFIDLFTGLNDIVKSIQSWASSFASPGLNAPPLHSLSNFFFPGGETFAFKNVMFSRHGDLAVLITYLNPTAAPQQVGAAAAPTVHMAVPPKHAVAHVPIVSGR